jgi:divalent metal cation (Fe/Co/Zn/Cd) transporter
MRPERLRRARRAIAESPALDESLDLYAVHLAPQEVLLAAKVHPAPNLSGDELARHLDELDVRLRRELPEIGEVFIDVTAHRRA